MKKTIKLFAIAGLASLIITSCKKDDAKESTDDSTTTATTTATEEEPEPEIEFPSDEVVFNTSLSNDNTKQWGEAKFELAGVGVQDCRFDDTMTLESDGSYSYNNGALTCGNDEATKTGTWEADYSTKIITFDKGESDEYTATITSLNEKQLILEGKWNTMDISGTYNSL